jgi:hypothetical protein
MSDVQNPEFMFRYLYNLSIHNNDYVLEKDKIITDYQNKGLFNNIEVVKDLIFEITNYDNNMLIHLNYFVDRLLLDDIAKEDLCNIIFTTELNRDTVFDIYTGYVQYLDILPVG